MVHLITVFIFTVASASCFDELSVTPFKYKLHFTFGNDVNLAGYNGSVTVDFKANSDLNILELDYFGNITDIKIRNLNTSIDIVNCTYESVGALAEQKYRLKTTDGIIIKGQLYEISVNFIGNDYRYRIGLERKFHKTQNSVKSAIVYTDFTQEFNMIYPRFARNAVNTKFELSITHNEKLTAVSNTPSIRIVNTRLVTTKFDETPPIALHSFGFAIGQLASVKIKNGRNLPITVYGSSLSIEFIDIFPEFVGKIFDAYETYLQHEIPVPKLDFILIPELIFHSITTYGLVMCRDTNIQYSLASLKPTLIIPTVGKAIGDHFFMNMYGSIGAPFHWIKDGVSLYLTVHLLENLEPYTDNLYKMISYHNSFEIEHTLDNIRLSDVNSRRDVRYTKSAALFRMINDAIGDLKFQMILRAAVKNRTDFIPLLAQEFGDKPNFNEFIDGWINQKGYPIVTLTRNYTSGEITVSQNNYGWSNRGSDVKWWIPYSYATASKPNFVTQPNRWLSKRSDTISVNVSSTDWIILNKHAIGYFLVNYDETNWNLIIEELTNGDLNKIDQKNRDHLLTTAYLLVSSKEMSNSTFFNLLRYLKREPKARPWLVADQILDKIVNRDLTKEYASQLNAVINSIFSDIYDNYEESLFFNKLFEITRVIAMKWACYAGHVKCLNDFEKMSNVYVQLLDYNHSTVMDAEVKNLMFCYGFQNESNYIKLYGNYKAASYDEMITNRIECHLHTNMFRSEFIRDFIFSTGNVDAVELILMPKFQEAVPDLIYEVFDYNFEEFRLEYNKIESTNKRLGPFETLNGMLRQLERYDGQQGNGFNRLKLNEVVSRIRKEFGDEVAGVMVSDLD